MQLVDILSTICYNIIKEKEGQQAERIAGSPAESEKTMKAIEMFNSETSRNFYRELYLLARNKALPEIERLEKEAERLRYYIGAAEYQIEEYKKHPYDEIVVDEDDEDFSVTVKETIRHIAKTIIEQKRYLDQTYAIIAYLKNK